MCYKTKVTILVRAHLRSTKGDGAFIVKDCGHFEKDAHASSLNELSQDNETRRLVGDLQR